MAAGAWRHIVARLGVLVGRDFNKSAAIAKQSTTCFEHTSFEKGVTEVTMHCFAITRRRRASFDPLARNDGPKLPFA
jgi:hypothetical protein